MAIATRHVAGVHLDGSILRVAEMRGSNPIRVAELPLPAGAVDRDEIIDEAAVAQAIKSLWKGAKIGTRNVVLSVPAQQMVARPADFPRLDPAELRAALKFEVADLVPFPADDVAFDYYDQGDRIISGQRHARMLVIAARASSVTAFIDSVTAARLNVVGVDAWPGALLRALGTADREQLGPELIINLVNDGVQVLIHDERTLLLARTVGGLSRAVIGAELEAELARIEQIRSRMAGSSFAEPARETRQRLHPATEAVRSTLEHYRQQPDSVEVSSVRVSGDTAMAATVASELSTVLPTSISIVTMRGDRGIEGARRRGKSTEPEQSVLAVGLASPADVSFAPPLDFLPGSVRQASSRRRVVRTAALSAAASVAVIGAGAWTMRTPTPVASAQIAPTQQRLSELTMSLQTIGGQGTSEAVTLLNRREALEGQSVEWDRIVTAIGSIVADGSLQAISSGLSSDGVTPTVQVTVLGQGPRSLGGWMEGLSAIAGLSEVTASTTAVTDGSPFTITALVRPATAPAVAPGGSAAVPDPATENPPVESSPPPVAPAPVEPAPVEPAPVEANSVEPAPVDASPAEAPTPTTEYLPPLSVGDPDVLKALAGVSQP
jgi:type IV pilus assembly protein PilM